MGAGARLPAGTTAFARPVSRRLRAGRRRVVGAGGFTRPASGAAAVHRIAWRLSHLGEPLALRADHSALAHALTRDDFRSSGDAAGAVSGFGEAAGAWRRALLGADDAAPDTVGHCTCPYGNDGENPLLDIVRWVDRELLHHGVEIALLRDLCRARHRTRPRPRRRVVRRGRGRHATPVRNGDTGRGC